jgi:small GTP-binding protein
MISKKICLLGAFSVGKTSLVEQFVHSIFSDKYLTTLGVKISKKDVAVDSATVTLVLWDMEGKDTYADVNLAYLRGAMGYFVVIDGMRKETLQAAMDLHHLAEKLGGKSLPFYFLINKADLVDQWEVTDVMLDSLEKKGIKFFRTSAKTGQYVNEAFNALARDMLLSSRA